MTTRNVAGVQLLQVSRAVYEQQIGKQRRWYVRYQKGKSFAWRVTLKFTEKPENEYLRNFKLLTDAVVWANYGAGKHKR